jgi:hypothetical protein
MRESGCSLYFGGASQETVRRVLKGLVIPQRWETAYAVYAPLLHWPTSIQRLCSGMTTAIPAIASRTK